jgi:hypothetical protein
MRWYAHCPGFVVRQSLRKQCERTLHVMLVELEKLEPKHPLRAHAAPLEGFAKAALAALDARSKVKAERGIAANDVDEWKEGVNALRLTTYAELLKIAAEKGYGRAWADAFFPSDAGGATEAPEPPPAPAPAGDDKPEVA